MASETIGHTVRADVCAQGPAARDCRAGMPVTSPVSAARLGVPGNGRPPFCPVSQGPSYTAISFGRARNADRPGTAAQTRVGAANVAGFYLEYLAAKRW